MTYTHALTSFPLIHPSHPPVTTTPSHTPLTHPYHPHTFSHPHTHTYHPHTPITHPHTPITHPLHPSPPTLTTHPLTHPSPGSLSLLAVSSRHLAHLDDKIDTLGTNYPLNIPTSFTPSMHTYPLNTPTKQLINTPTNHTF